jgi:flagellar protein FliS
MNAARAYTRATQETASKERLMVLLFEAALKHMRQGGALLEQLKQADAAKVLTKARDIVVHLSATLDTELAPELAKTLGQVYVFVSWRLAHAATYHDVKAAREAEKAFAPIVEGFQAAVASLQAEAGPR